MAQQEMMIFKRAYDFSKWLLHHSGGFPTSHCFSVAVKIERAMLEFLRLIKQ